MTGGLPGLFAYEVAFHFNHPLGKRPGKSQDVNEWLKLEKDKLLPHDRMWVFSARATAWVKVCAMI
jgi:hypothetical protein